MNDEITIRGYCEECNSAILYGDEAYVNAEGRYFDSIECLCEYYDITKVEF